MYNNMNQLEKEKEEEFHKKRRMFCIFKDKLYIAEKNFPYSHEIWFEKERWIKNKKDKLMSEIVRGFTDSEGNIYFYIGNNFEINKKTENIFFKHLKELVNRLSINIEAKIFGGLIKKEIGVIWPPLKIYGKIEDFWTF